MGQWFFAVRSVPPDSAVTESARSTLRRRLTDMASSCLEAAGAEPTAVFFTVALLRLVIEDPYEWQTLGPLVAGELNRAQDVERIGQAAGVQERRLNLDGRIPEDP